MAKKPELPEGYLGAQEKFEEFGLSTDTHSNSEITLNDNIAEIGFKAKNPVKVTATLLCCKDGKEYPEMILSQSTKGTVSFCVNFPESGYYKLQLYALPMSDDSKSLPGVFNYIINVNRAINAVYPFPKQYAQWKDECYLHEPRVLHSGVRLSNVYFKITMPKAKAAAIVVDGNWTHLDKKGDVFEGKTALDHYRGKDVKVTLNANYGGDESKYTCLLEYRLN